jgi:hypothetical protein
MCTLGMQLRYLACSFWLVRVAGCGLIARPRDGITPLPPLRHISRGFPPIWADFCTRKGKPVCFFYLRSTLVAGHLVTRGSSYPFPALSSTFFFLLRAVQKVQCKVACAKKELGEEKGKEDLYRVKIK